MILSPKDWDVFMQALDSPPAPNERLKKLMAGHTPWKEINHKGDDSVVHHLRKITEFVMIKSGYPDSTVTNPAEAFAYGYAIGSLIEATKRWEDRYERAYRERGDGRDKGSGEAGEENNGRAD